MGVLSLKLLILCIINLSVMEVYSKPTRITGRRRSSFDNSIFKNRTSRCIQMVENLDEMEELSQQPIDDDLDDIPVRQSEEKLEDVVPEGVVKKNITKESAFRRFIRCLTGRPDEAVSTVSYKKNEEQATIEKNVDKASSSESSAKPKTERAERSYYGSRLEVIEPNLSRRNSAITGSLTEIGVPRLPKSNRLSVSTGEDLAVPGPSNIYSEKKEFPSLEERNMVRRKWLECNGDVLHIDSDEEEPKDDRPDKKDRSKL